MRDLCQLLTAQHRSPLAALSLSMPCPTLPADMQQAAKQADTRLQHAGSMRSQQSSAASAEPGALGSSSCSTGEGQPFTMQWLASLTPGIPAAGGSQRFAEMVVLRGPRCAGVPAELGAAAEALDAALAAERLRCVRQRALVAQPLPVPLPFPHMFARGVSQSGDAPARTTGSGTSTGGGSQGIASCAVLTRLAGTAAFGPAVSAVQRRFSTAAGSAQGQATLESWGLGREELGGLQERLAGLAHAYEEEEV